MLVKRIYELMYFQVSILAQPHVHTINVRMFSENVHIRHAPQVSHRSTLRQKRSLLFCPGRQMKKYRTECSWLCTRQEKGHYFTGWLMMHSKNVSHIYICACVRKPGQSISSCKSASFSSAALIHDYMRVISLLSTLFRGKEQRNRLTTSDLTLERNLRKKRMAQKKRFRLLFLSLLRLSCRFPKRTFLSTSEHPNVCSRQTVDRV